MPKKSVERIFGTFATLGFNWIIFYSAILTYMSYYTPGNPIRPQRFDMDIIGALGIYIGASQLLYLTPVIIFLTRQRKQNLVQGIGLGMAITGLLNILLLPTFK